MREDAKIPDSVLRAVDCPKCKGSAPLLAPMKITDKRNAVYGCPACGNTFKADGGAYVANVNELRDVFRGATEGHRALTEALAGEKLNPASLVLLQAQLVEYGTTMWFDGLKQGLLLGAAAAQKAAT